MAKEKAHAAEAGKKKRLRFTPNIGSVWTNRSSLGLPNRDKPRPIPTSLGRTVNNR
jgi:hypothetical protein